MPPLASGFAKKATDAADHVMFDKFAVNLADSGDLSGTAFSGIQLASGNYNKRQTNVSGHK